MLPHFAVDIEIAEIDAGRLRVVWIDEVMADGVGDNLMYEDISGTTWQEVNAVIAEEAALIDSASLRAVDEDDFDRIVDVELRQRYPGDDFDEGPLSPFTGLDAGVMSAVAALSASGCITTTSCRGHRAHSEPNPLVRFAADEERLLLVQAAATSAGCGLLLDEDGMLQLYATSILAFIDFARETMRHSDAFDAVSTSVARQRPPGLAHDFLGTIRRRDLS